MGRHDHLAMTGLVHSLKQLQELHLPQRRQRRLRLIKYVDALPLAALLEETQKTLAVRIRQKIRIGSNSVEISRHRKESLGTEEPALGDLGQPTCAKRLRQLASHHFKGRRVVDRPVALAAAGLVVTCECGDALKQGRLSCAVLANNDRDGAVEAKLEAVAQEWQTKRIGVAIGHPCRIDPEPL